LYDDPRDYWTLRGGDDYFREQEGQPARGERAAWVARRVASYRPTSILEVGCGYGKVLRELRGELGDDVPIVGVDFSPTQLGQATRYLTGCANISLFLARGERLPFPDGAFDLVLTSAVILHNPPAEAATIRREVIRVARRYAAHNEERNVSYNRYGYDTSEWYRIQGISLAEIGPIPMDTDPDASQFCVAEISRG
jgi:SAM-dependent methyltransferase